MLKRRRKSIYYLLALLLGLLVAIPPKSQTDQGPKAEQDSELRVRQTHDFTNFVVQQAEYVLPDRTVRPVLRLLRKQKDGSLLVVREIFAEGLPLETTDCELLCTEIEGRELRSRCYGLCLFGGPIFLTFDEDFEKLYFYAQTSIGHNVDFVLFSFTVSTGSITRLNRTFGSSIGSPQLSPSRRYLAFRIVGHISGAEAAWGVHILDTQTGQIYGLAAVRARRPVTKNRITEIKRFEWLPGDRISYVQETRERSDHDKPEPRVLSRVQRVFDVKTEKLVAEKKL